MTSKPFMFKEQLKVHVQRTILKMVSHSGITWIIILAVAVLKLVPITGGELLFFTVATIGVKSVRDYYKEKLNG